MSYPKDNATQQAHRRYVRNTMDAPLLSREEEFSLARRWKDHKDEKALHTLIKAYARLVVSIATKYKNYGLPADDLVQEGNIGLMEAAARFDPDLENRFSTYAMWWIRAQIQDFILRNWSIVRTGTTSRQKSLFFNLRRLRAQIEGQSTRAWMDDDAIADIAKELGVTPKDVAAMEARMNAGDQALSTTIGEYDAPTLQDMMPDPGPTPEDIVIGMKDGTTRSTWLNEALSALSERERNIVAQRQMRDDVVTLDALGKQLGISKERVRQLEKKALDKLRTALEVKANTLRLEKDMPFM